MKKKKRAFLELARRYADVAVDPSCPHAGECGGCALQHLPYESQLSLKRDHLAALFDGAIDVGPVQPADPFGYRNRMDFVTAFGKIGLRRAGSFKHVVDIGSCRIQQDAADEAFRRVRELLAGVEDYDYLAHAGYLRYVVIRQGRFTGEVMLNFVVASPDGRGRLDPVIAAMADRVASISILLSAGRADLSFGEILEHAKGGAIDERLDDLRFAIAPNAFFQSNSEIALRMYRRIREHARGHVLDLYAGIGSITLFIAGACETVTGVEIVEEAVTAARANAVQNGIANASFVHGDAADFLATFTGRCTTLVLDPPRAGMHPAAVKRIAALAPERIVYMSCNPESFKDDLLRLDGYRLTSFEAYDMFPQTPHIETLAVLDRR
ncbi:MAG TPA: 23S rRNA (uracil(1939)-C(5))-methyltransferase RlmD [Spirochaetota bacterium]|nr:23S rRNA (uracil(1939)-C(5))-methyltransferase RlmD [Spirochaetota bacterium]HOS38711.1 23S rRNA (uracil(1939)-C(5))-methyltransferase RlmD [Spirochaetota bacterium]HPU86774.1 23S rRNA (uracil(1939)-C(5))-methyltransferase RlmD [Spirochaetota bacterium]